MKNFWVSVISIAVTIALFLVGAKYIVPPVAKRMSQALYHTTYVEYCLLDEEFFSDHLRPIVISRAEELGVTEDNYSNIADQIEDELTTEDSIDRLASQALQTDCFMDAARKRIENNISYGSNVWRWLYVHTDD